MALTPTHSPKPPCISSSYASHPEGVRNPSHLFQARVRVPKMPSLPRQDEAAHRRSQHVDGRHHVRNAPVPLKGADSRDEPGTAANHVYRPKNCRGEKFQGGGHGPLPAKKQHGHTRETRRQDGSLAPRARADPTCGRGAPSPPCPMRHSQERSGTGLAWATVDTGDGAVIDTTGSVLSLSCRATGQHGDAVCGHLTPST